jgi:hypothetical protein
VTRITSGGGCSRDYRRSEQSMEELAMHSIVDRECWQPESRITPDYVASGNRFGSL